jgi:acyl-CoA thioesterase FadM
MNLYFRFFYIIIKNYLFRRRITANDESLLDMRVLPTDLDLNMHMNNGRYLTILDIARTEFLIRSGMDKVFYKNKLGGVTGGVHITFFKELNLFEKYQVRTKALHWDDMWFYIEHEFLKNNIVTAHAIVKVTFTKKRKRVAPQIVIDQLEDNIIKPVAPKYLEELIHGESDMIDSVKKYNKKIKNS